MANVLNSAETLPNISIARVDAVHERYRRQTDDRRTGDNI